MTRLELFKKWLKEQGVDLRDFEGFDLDKHGCAMLICPIDVPRDEDSNGICNNCPYNEFWIKEMEED